MADKNEWEQKIECSQMAFVLEKGFLMLAIIESSCLLIRCIRDDCWLKILKIRKINSREIIELGPGQLPTLIIKPDSSANQL